MEWKQGISAMSSAVKFLCGLVVFTIVLRLTPYVLTKYDVHVASSTMFYPWNFLPLTAACLYAGAYISDRRFQIGLPLLALLISDIGIWGLTGQFAWGFPSDRWAVYVCFMITIALGSGLGRRAWPLRSMDAFARGMLAETIFFVVTNFAYFLVQNDLPHTSEGLITCYLAAIPFAGKSFASTAIFSLLLFSPLAVTDTSEAESSASQTESVLS